MRNARIGRTSEGATALILAVVFLALLLPNSAQSQVGLPPVEPAPAEPEDAEFFTLDESAETTKEPQLPPRFGIHRENYVLVYSEVSGLNFAGAGIRDLDDTEIKFQLSLRYRLARLGKANSQGDLVFAYTNTSFWQLYNTDESSPFRTTDHEPELFYEWPAGPTDLDEPLKMYRIGIAHESNGENSFRSRSWNRLYGEFLYASKSDACRPTTTSGRPQEGTCVSFKAWWIFEHDEFRNPNIEDYVGNFELRGERVWERWRNLRLSILLRNNLRSSYNRGAVQLDCSFALHRGAKEDLRLRLQYFEGYGESLIDYDYDSRRFGVGFEFTY